MAGAVHAQSESVAAAARESWPMPDFTTHPAGVDIAVTVTGPYVALRTGRRSSRYEQTFERVALHCDVHEGGDAAEHV